MNENTKYKTRILQRLSNGVTTIDELKILIRFYEKKYKKSGKKIYDLIEWLSYVELLRRLKTSVFSEIGNEYPEKYKKYCIYGEYQNTKLFIDSTYKLIKIGRKIGDITSPDFYGQPDPGYTFPIETLVHITLRHNFTLNDFINQDSRTNGHNPSSFSKGGLAEPMLLLLMSLNVISENNWIKPAIGKNLICHIKAAGKVYTIIRKGSSKEIKSFYPRNDNHLAEVIELVRNPEKMEFNRLKTGGNKE